MSILMICRCVVFSRSLSELWPYALVSIVIGIDSVPRVRALQLFPIDVAYGHPCGLFVINTLRCN